MIEPQDTQANAVVLTIPYGTSVREVMRMYREARGALPRAPRVWRPAHTGETLVAFVDERRARGLTWLAIHEEWNETHPEMAYRWLPQFMQRYASVRNKKRTEGANA